VAAPFGPEPMEFPAKVTRVGQLIAALMLAALSLCVWAESRSALAGALRAGQPWPCWVWLQSPDAPAPELYLALYQPARRLLDLIYIPERRRGEEDRAGLLSGLPLASGAAAAPALSFALPQAASSEPPLIAGEWLLERTSGLGVWRTFARALAGRRAGRAGTFDLLLLALELHRLPPERLRPSLLPEADDDRRFLFGNILAPPSDSRSGAHAIAVEVLNATRKAGVASEATDVLRLGGADVVNVGNAPAVRDRTVVYDRTGRAENAEAVRALLGCPAARAATQISPKRLVDVTVMLAEDCASSGRSIKGGVWNSSRF